MPKQKTQKNDGLRILKLEAENVKRIKVVSITPEGDVVIISGKNGQGKTSVLDSFWLALGGKKASPQIPIRKGQEKASVKVELGSKNFQKIKYIIERVWSDNEHSHLKVTTGKGDGFGTPQQLLDSLLGELSFDPLTFARADKKIQRDFLMEAGKIKGDWDKLTLISGSDWSHYPNYIDATDAAVKTLFETRTEINRRVKSLANQIDAIKIPEEYEKAKPVDVTKLLDRQKKVDHLAELQRNIKTTEEEIENLNDRLKELQQERKKLLDKGISIIDGGKIREQIKKADTINKFSNLIEKRKELKETYKTDADESERLTNVLNQLRELKTEVVAKAKLPIDGLGFDEEGVTYNGLPFSQVSDSEKLKISMAIAMALNPQIRVIRITDGSLLDKDSMKIIEEMAEKNDFQVWLEVVDDTGKVGIYIEDGSIK